ncbi:M6 family metalloprotease domain-containing protein, partial [Cyclobacteriaceae bacterium]|nr:M6 family metalloprotease domain-containing protein [Cyclobacteriaceae bacterium]
VSIFEIKAQIPVSDCPASPYAIEITQPDNTKISIMGRGSMKNSWSETLDGYTIVKNKEEIYEYAQKNNGQLVSSGFLVVENGQNLDKQNFLDKQGKHLRPTVTAKELSNIRFMDSSANNNPEIDLAFPTQGTHKVLVLLIDYPDLKRTHTVAEFEKFMNQENYNSTGSFRDYFLKISDNKLDVNADVVEWHTADSAYQYYGKKNGYERAQELVREAVAAAEIAGVDFSIYDNDKDGYVDGVIVVHAGPGAEEGSQEDYIWSHRWALNSNDVKYDGVIINDYMTNPERRNFANNGAGGIVGIGVFCHEFGHGLGLPDLYDIDYTSAGIGSWGLMSFGGYLGAEEVPGFMSAWCRANLNWVVPEQISSGAYSLASSTTSTKVYKINTSVPKEYFLLENRQQSGQDAYLKGSGLAIWHIDDNQSVTDNTDNSDENHRLVDLEQADGLGHLYTEDGASDDGDLFPGSAENTSFTDITLPNSKTYDSSASGIEITEITEVSGMVNFTVSGGDESYDPVNVAFSLDLTDKSSAQTPPYVWGEWDDYCYNCNVMADADGDGIWTSTISMARGDYKFIFLTGVALQSDTEYEDSLIGNDCSIKVPESEILFFNIDWYWRTLEVTGATESQLYGGTSVKWNACPADLPKISIAAATTKVLEGDSIKVYVTMTPSSTDTVKIDWIGSGFAILDKDYSMDARIIILPGDTAGFTMIRALDNDIYTPTDKSLSISVSNIFNAILSSTNGLALSIMNNDAAPNVTLEVVNGSVNEGDSISFKATISLLSEVATQIVFGYSGTTLKGIDYDVLDSMMAISPGDTMGMITIQTNQNNLYELDKNILVTISDLTHATSEIGEGIELTLVNIDEAPTLSVTSDQLSMDEGDSVVLSFNLSAVSGTGTSIGFSLSGTAESVDYIAPSTSITIPAGDSTKTWTVVSIDDDDYETQESLVISFDIENAVYNEGDLTIILFSEDLLGLSEQIQISFYPNPTTGMLILEMIDFRGLIIYDLSGKKLIQSNKPIIDISQLKKGTYILEASDKSGRLVKSKILKK